MSNARDKANIPALNFSSTGIDDNATSTAITINSSEQVGIGITTPGYPLQINSSAQTTLLHLVSTAGTSSAITFANTGSNDSITIGAENDDLKLRTDDGVIKFFTNENSEKMRIDSSGLVRVGNTSHTNSIISANFDLVIGNESSGASGLAILAPSNENSYLGFFDNNDSGSFRGALHYNHTNDYLRFYTYGSERMRITSSGDVLIGDSNPDYKRKLTVSGNGSADTGLFMYDGSAGTYLNITTNGANGVVDLEANARTGSYPPLTFTTGTSERMRIDSSGNVGIGTTTPSSFNSLADNLVVGTTSGENGITIASGTGNSGRFVFSDNTTSPFVGAIEYAHSSDAMSFYTSGLQRMLIDSSGNILQNTTSTSRTNLGNKFIGGDGGITIVSQYPNLPGQFNRLSQDGTIINFLSQSTVEGTISVSGTTVSYNGFTGTHWSRFTDNSTPSILRGTVLETLDEMCDWYNLEFDVTDENENTYKEKIPHVLTDTQSVGDTVTYNHEGTDYQAIIVKEGDIKHMKSKVSDTVDAKNVYGVFVAYDLDGEGYNDFYVASAGSFVVRIKQGETVAKGDLLQSNGDGTAKVQTDDAVRSSSFAKVLSTTIIETYDDGSYLVPCSLMC